VHATHVRSEAASIHARVRRGDHGLARALRVRRFTPLFAAVHCYSLRFICTAHVDGRPLSRGSWGGVPDPLWLETGQVHATLEASIGPAPNAPPLVVHQSDPSAGSRFKSFCATCSVGCVPCAARTNPHNCCSRPTLLSILFSRHAVNLLAVSSNRAT
jgi:hypothetical protein